MPTDETPIATAASPSSKPQAPESPNPPNLAKLTFPSLQAMLEHTFDYAADYICSSQADLLGAFIIETEDGQLMYVLAPWHGDAERAAILDAIHTLLRDRRATRYAVLNEAWMARSIDPNYARIADRPDRIEVLLVAAASRDGEKLFAMAPIVRNDAGKRCLDERVSLPADAAVGGALADLFAAESPYPGASDGQTLLLKVGG